eukprot:g2205.t1
MVIGLTRETCLFRACRSGNIEAVRLLVEQDSSSPLYIDDDENDGEQEDKKTTESSSRSQLNRSEKRQNCSGRRRPNRSSKTRTERKRKRDNSQDSSSKKKSQSKAPKKKAARKPMTPRMKRALLRARRLAQRKRNAKQYPIVNIEVNGDSTPLMVASECGHLKVVKYLIEKGANPDLCRADDGCPPLYFAAQNGHYKVLKYLLAEGASANIARSNGATALHVATVLNRLNCVKALVKAGAKVTAKTTDGMTSLFIAAREGFLECTKVLVKAKKGFTPSLHRFSRLTPIDIALYMSETRTNTSRTENCWKVAQWLMMTKKYSDLQLAVDCGSLEEVKALLRKPNIKADDIATTIPIAQERHRKLLIKKKEKAVQERSKSTQSVTSSGKEDEDVPDGYAGTVGDTMVETSTILRAVAISSKPWTRESHLYYSQRFRDCVKTILLCSIRASPYNSRQRSPSEEHRDRVKRNCRRSLRLRKRQYDYYLHLPSPLWIEIFSYCSRDWFTKQ